MIRSVDHAPELPPLSGVLRRDHPDRLRHRDHPRELQALDHKRDQQELPDESPADVDQVHQRASAGEASDWSMLLILASYWSLKWIK